MLPIPTSISTETCPFELKYKGRRTRNTQVCRHKLTAYVYLAYMSSCARLISEKLVFEPFLKSVFSENKHALRVAAAFGEKSWWTMALKISKACLVRVQTFLMCFQSFSVCFQAFLLVRGGLRREILVKNDILNLESALLAKTIHMLTTKSLQIDNFFEWILVSVIKSPT